MRVSAGRVGASISSMDGRYAKSTVDESLTAFEARDVLNWRVETDLL